MFTLTDFIVVLWLFPVTLFILVPLLMLVIHSVLILLKSIGVVKHSSVAPEGEHARQAPVLRVQT